MEDWVLADTVIWASFFSKPDSPEKRAVDDLIDTDRVVLIGPILADVLLGFRRKAQADWVASRLRMAHFFEASWDDWKSAAEIGRELAAKGHAIPMTDHIVAAVAKRMDTAVYSTDPHFDLMPELKRYRPPP
jgi:predicted nucleic acid-binding protein